MSLQLVQSLSFLKSSRYIFQLLSVPKFISDGMTGPLAQRESGRFGNAVLVDNGLNTKTAPELLSYMPVLCDSIEFPGQTITATDFRMPGRMKIKVPTLREINEIQASFLYPIEVPMYELFSSWISNISTVSSKTKYYNDVLGSAYLKQYGEDSAVGLNDWGIPLLKLKLDGLYPLSINSMQSNWSDDGFHRINISFFVEDFFIDSVSAQTAKKPANDFEAELIKRFSGRKTISFGGQNYSTGSPTFSSEADRSNFASSINFKFP